MRKPRPEATADAPAIAPLPGWIAASAAESLDGAAFRAGAALGTVQRVLAGPEVPHALWRSRLALAAAELCAGLAGRREGPAALRDALHLTRPGDDPGPAGAILRQWSRAVARPVSVAGLGRAVEGLAADRIALCLDAAGGNPVDRAAAVLESVLADSPRAETAALILAEAALSRALGWDPLVPLLSLALKPRALRLTGDELRLACHRAVALGAGVAVPLAADLARAAARLRAVAPKLRAKGAARAVEMFLTRDAVAPAELTAFLSDRAARRLCDRLVGLGAVRELTGRDSFRLYGV